MQVKTGPHSSRLLLVGKREVVFFLSVVLIIGFILNGASDFPYSRVMLCLNIAALGMIYVLKPKKSIVGFAHPIVFFSLAFIQYYILPPIVQIYFFDSIFLQTIHYGHLQDVSGGDYILARSLTVSLVGLIAFYFGYVLAPLNPLERARILRLREFWSVRITQYIIIASLIGFVVAVAWFFHSVGLSEYINTPRSMRHDLYAGSYISGFFVDWGSTAAFFSLVLIFEKLKHRPYYYGVFLLFIVLTYIWFNLFVFSGSRIQVVRIAAMLLIYWHLRINRVSILRLFTLGFIGIIFIVIMGYLRSGLGDLNASVSVFNLFHDRSNLLTIVIYALDFPTAYDIYLMIVNHLPDYDYGYGMSYLKLLFLFVPRSIWPDKPENITWISTRLFRPEQLDLGVSYNPTILGEMYYNFGIFGVISLCFLFGMCCHLPLTYYKKNRFSIGGIIIYSVLLFSIIEQFRGAFSDITKNYLFFYIVPAIIIILFSSRKKYDTSSSAFQ